MYEKQNLSWDDIKAMFAETSQLIAETSQLIKATNQESSQIVKKTRQLNQETSQLIKEASLRLDKESKEWHEKFDKESKEWHEKFDKESKEWNENFEKEKRETDRRLAKLEKLIGGIGNNNGEMAEEFFFNAFRKDKIFMNEQYDIVKKGYFHANDPYKGEYDIVFFNGKSVAIVEVKYNAKPNNVDIETLTSRVERLKEYSPECKNHNIYLAVAAMSFKKGLASKLHNAGIATVHPVGKKMVIYDKGVKTF